MDLGLGVREMAAHPTETLSRASAILTARVVVAIVLAVLLTVAALVTMPEPDGFVLALYGLTLIPIGASTRWILLGRERTRSVALARAAGEALMVLLVFALVRGRDDLFKAPLAQFTGDALAAGLLLWWVTRSGIHLRFAVDWSAIRPLVGRATPLIASALLGLLIYNSDLIFLRFFRDRATVGLYAAAYLLVSFISNMGTAYGLSLLPSLTRTAAVPADHRGLYHTATAHVFAIGFPITLGGCLLAWQITMLVFGSEYSDSANALRILIWAIPLSLVRDIPVMALMASGREDRIMRLTAWAAAAGIALNFLLIPPYGLIGAATATVATEGVRMMLALAAVRKYGFQLTGISRLWKPLVAGGVMAAVLVLAAPSALVLAVALGALGYVASLAMLGGISFRRGLFPSLNV
jgi:O-antigen/teichoic acid export membrane protein